MKTKSLKQFKRDHQTFFKSGDIDNFFEHHRVWRGHLITIAQTRTGYKARAWGENSAGALFPIVGAKYFTHNRTFDRTLRYAVCQMRILIDYRIKQLKESN